MSLCFTFSADLQHCRKPKVNSG